MPEMEEAVEELRLSVVDHVHDILNKLDIDELSADEIRQKLSVVGLSVDRMSEDWLPNGKFYKMYSLIKNNRTTLPAIESIVKSGGQFESLWSDSFEKTTEYNYKDIQIERHYYVSGRDGYFYVSGDTSRSTTGHVSSSAVTALQSDILLSQALPAGYTYLYVPWPRPLYPVDSEYYYNVNMLNFDRLQYVINCTDWSNSDDYISTNTPASDEYYKDNNLPTGTPFWFDYHFINGYTDEDNNYEPVAESGKFYDADGKEYDTPDESCIRYELDESCKELGDTNAVFPTRCYTHSLSKTSKPTISENQSIDTSIQKCKRRLILLSSKSSIKTYYALKSFGDFTTTIVGTLVRQLPTDISSYVNESQYEDIIASLQAADANASVFTTYDNVDYVKLGLDEYYYPNKFKESHIFWSKQIPDFTNNVARLMNCVTCSRATLLLINKKWTKPVDITEYIKPEYSLTYVCNYANRDYKFLTIEYSVDTDSLTPQSDTQYGPYRFDALWCSAMHRHDHENHVKTYRPVWNESSPLFSLSQANSGKLNGASNSLLGWFLYKQDTTITTDRQYNELHEMSDTARYNVPSISEITHTNVDRPTIGRLNALYASYANTDGSNKQFTNYTDLYTNGVLDNVDAISAYQIIGMYKMVLNQPTQVSHDGLFLITDPSGDRFSLCANDARTYETSYVMYTKSKYHKLWLSNDKSDISVSDASIKLYSDTGSDLFFATNNDKYIRYNIIGIYNSQGVSVGVFDCSIECVLTDDINFSKHVVNAYLNVNGSLTGAYILATVEITDGSLVDKSAKYIPVYNQYTNDNKIAKYVPDDDTYEIDGTVYSKDEFYAADFVVKKTVLTGYYGDEVVTVYKDDDEQPYDVSDVSFSSIDASSDPSIEEWKFN